MGSLSLTKQAHSGSVMRETFLLLATISSGAPLWAFAADASMPLTRCEPMPSATAPVALEYPPHRDLYWVGTAIVAFEIKKDGTVAAPHAKVDVSKPSSFWGPLIMEAAGKAFAVNPQHEVRSAQWHQQQETIEQSATRAKAALPKAQERTLHATLQAAERFVTKLRYKPRVEACHGELHVKFEAA